MFQNFVDSNNLFALDLFQKFRKLKKKRKHPYYKLKTTLLRFKNKKRSYYLILKQIHNHLKQIRSQFLHKNISKNQKNFLEKLLCKLFLSVHEPVVVLIRCKNLDEFCKLKKKRVCSYYQKLILFTRKLFVKNQNLNSILDFINFYRQKHEKKFDSKNYVEIKQYHFFEKEKLKKQKEKLEKQKEKLEKRKKKVKKQKKKLKKQKKKLKKQNKKTVRLYAQFTKQNSIFTITNLEGNVICTVSNGSVGYQNSKSKTKYASQAAALETGKKILERGFKYIIFFLKGRNKGRKRCVKSFKKLGLTILKIYDKTVVCHNGCRPTKIPRR